MIAPPVLAVWQVCEHVLLPPSSRPPPSSRADAAHDGDGAQRCVQHGHVALRLLLRAARQHTVRHAARGAPPRPTCLPVRRPGQRLAAGAGLMRPRGACCLLPRAPPACLASCSRACLAKPASCLTRRCMLALSTARWLDLFAGTGAVGIEALSRGVGECHFVEMRWGSALGGAERESVATDCLPASLRQVVPISRPPPAHPPSPASACLPVALAPTPGRVFSSPPPIPQPLGGQQLPHAQPGDVRAGERGGGAHRGEGRGGVRGRGSSPTPARPAGIQSLLVNAVRMCRADACRPRRRALMLHPGDPYPLNRGPAESRGLPAARADAQPLCGRPL